MGSGAIASKPVGDLSSMEADNGSSKPLKIAFNGGQVLCQSPARFHENRGEERTWVSNFGYSNFLKIKIN